MVVHAPSGWDPTRPLSLVVFFHGWNGCAVVLEASGRARCRPDVPDDPERRGWGLGEVHDRAGTNTLFVVPQLAYLQRDGAPGRFGQSGGFREFLDELLDRLASRLGGGARQRVERITVVAHSAGFEAALAIAQRGGVDGPLRDVVLLDALYAGPALFAQWVLGPPATTGERRLVSLHGGRGLTARFSRQLGRSLLERLGPEAVALDPRGRLEEAVRAHRVVVARRETPHGAFPRRHMAEILRGLGLPERRLAAGGAGGAHRR